MSRVVLGGAGWCFSREVWKHFGAGYDVINTFRCGLAAWTLPCWGFSVPFSPWDGWWSLCWCSPTGRHQEALEHLQEAFGHSPAEDFARARLAVLQLQSRNVARAAAPLSVLARRDEKDLAFLLNFVDTKQQQHLAQVQPFSLIPCPWIQWGKNWEAKVGLQAFLPPWEVCGKSFIRWTGHKLAFPPARSGSWCQTSSTAVTLISLWWSITATPEHLGFLFSFPGTRPADAHTEIQDVWGAAGRNLTDHC